jgi:hypothetical protein
MSLTASEQDIFDRIIKAPKPSGRCLVVLGGGYFTTTHGVDEFAIQSERSAVKIATYLKRKLDDNVRIVFAVLANDLGRVCSEDASICELKPQSLASNSPDMPAELQSELESYPHFRPNQLISCTERTMRNRGLRHFRGYTQAHSRAIEENASHLAINPSGGKQQLCFRGEDGTTTAVAEMRNGWVWSSYCPLIMAQYYADLVRRSRDRFSGTSFCIVADLAFADDRYKVNKGAELALMSYPHLSNVQILNVCYADNDQDLYTVDEHICPDISR